MRYNKSMSTIYIPRGRAKEYASLALNIYNGCDHGCIYCYAPLALKRERQQFHGQVTPKVDIIQRVSKDIAKLASTGQSSSVLLCFTGDPYCRADMRYQVTRQILEKFREHNQPFCILTKGGCRALRDIDLYSQRDTFACTLTLLDANESQRWEPGAALPEERIYTLREFHRRGVRTWISLEPVINPDATLEIIRRTATFVDEFKVGVLNYHPHAKKIDWRKFAHEAKTLLEKLGARYIFKEDVKRYLVQ